MKLSAGATTRFLKNPDPNICVVLVYGPDYGLIKERSQSISHTHLGDAPGSFSQTILTDTDIKTDPACLQDAFCALPLGGGPRVVRLKTSAELFVKPLKALLASLDGKQIIPAALLLIEAGDLGPRSPLRKCVEQDKTHAVTLACYAPDLRDLRDLATKAAQTHNLGFADGALDFLISHLPPDRAIAHSEVEKLVLYTSQGDVGIIEIPDVRAIVADSLNHNLDVFTSAVADGAAQRTDQLLGQALEAGQSPIALLRALQRYFLRLSEAKASVAGGRDIKSAMAGLRPPVFFAYQNAFSRQLSSWSLPTLESVIEHCLATERAMKKSGAHPENLIARLVIKISTMGGRT